MAKYISESLILISRGNSQMYPPQIKITDLLLSEVGKWGRENQRHMAISEHFTCKSFKLVAFRRDSTPIRLSLMHSTDIPPSNFSSGCMHLENLPKNPNCWL